MHFKMPERWPSEPCKEKILQTKNERNALELPTIKGSTASSPVNGKFHQTGEK